MRTGSSSARTLLTRSFFANHSTAESVTDEDGDEAHARVIEQLGNLVRVELLDDKEIEEVEASALRKAPRRRRAAAEEAVPEVHAQPEPVDAG